MNSLVKLSINMRRLSTTCSSLKLNGKYRSRSLQRYIIVSLNEMAHKLYKFHALYLFDNIVRLQSNQPFRLVAQGRHWSHEITPRLHCGSTTCLSPTAACTIASLCTANPSSLFRSHVRALFNKPTLYESPAQSLSNPA